MVKRRGRLVVVFGSALVAAACLGGGGGSGGGGGGGAVCRQAHQKLEGCGLIAGGEMFACEEPVNATERCEIDCALDATCDQLRALYCESDVDVFTQLLSCSEACGVDEFSCGDGDSIPSEWQCDGEEDCENGSDETGCGAIASNFECANGAYEVPDSWVCDGEEDCDDGSDEAGCPDVTTLSDILICD